jgi:hypothetical protein
MSKINEAGAAPRSPKFSQTALPWEEWNGLPVPAADREAWAQKIASGEGTLRVRSGDTEVNGDIRYDGTIDITEFHIRRVCTVPLPPDSELAKWDRLRRAAPELYKALRDLLLNVEHHECTQRMHGLPLVAARAALAKAEDRPSSLGPAPGDPK